MQEYVVLMWNRADLGQETAARIIEQRLHQSRTTWRSVHAASGCRVFLAERTISTIACDVLPDGHGVVLGSIFGRPHEADIADTSCSERADVSTNVTIAREDPQYLVERYWGSYVAIVTREDKATQWLLRSPLCQLPCLAAEYGGVQLFSAGLTTLIELELLSLSINWTYIARSLSKTTIPGETGLNEVTVVRGGQCIEWRKGVRSRKTIWELADAATGASYMADPDVAALAVRNTTRACVRAYASCHGPVLLRLSGGLDSSIVLACLRDAAAGHRVTAVNRYSPGADSDERMFARLAAEYCGCEVVSLPRDPGFDIRRLYEAQLTETPRAYLMLLGQAEAEMEIARSGHFGSIFTGDGGDEIFYSVMCRLTVADYIREHGMNRGLIQVALNAAHRERLSVWRMLREGIINGRKGYRLDMFDVAKQFDPLANWDVLGQMLPPTEAAVPRYRSQQGIPPARQFQIATLGQCDLLGSSEPYGLPGDPLYVRPLLSQPLIELCFRIPTFVLTRHGWDREMARRAFARELPNQIVWRRSKGGQESYTSRVFSSNLPFMREVLLNGHLVRKGILNRSKLESALSGGPSGAMRGMNKIAKHLNYEVWMSLCERHNVRMDAPSEFYPPKGMLKAS